jgi:hypothetical protein
MKNKENEPPKDLNQYSFLQFSIKANNKPPALETKREIFNQTKGILLILIEIE